MLQDVYVEQPAILATANVTQRFLTWEALTLRLLRLICHKSLHLDLALQVQPLDLVYLVELLRDAKLVADFERPENSADAAWDAESPQVFKVDLWLIR